MVSKYAEPILKKNKGYNYSLYDLVLPPDSDYIIDDESSDTKPSNQYYTNDNSKLKVTFRADPYYNSYRFSGNAIAHKGERPTGWKAYKGGARYFVNVK